MKKWKVYSIITETSKDAFKMIVPAPDKKAAAQYVEGNGDTVSIKETDYDINVGCLADTLARNGWGQIEIDIITRTLYQVGLDRIETFPY